MNPGDGGLDPFALFSWAVAGIFLLAGVLIAVNVLWLIAKAIRWAYRLMFPKTPDVPVVPEPETSGGDEGGQSPP